MTRLARRLLLATSLTLSSLLVAPAWAAATKVTLLLVCDTYDMSGKAGRGGYARIAGAASAERARGGHVVFVHAGDVFSPSLLSGFDQAESAVDLLNALKLDVFVPGNHEFDFGPDIFRRRIGAVQPTVLAANLREKDGSPVKGTADTKMLDFDGVKVGVVGITAQDSPVKSLPGDLVFSDDVETLRDRAAALRQQGADLVVAIVHAERAIDRRIVESRAADIVLSGDDHDLWIEYDGRVAAAEAKQDGEYLVAIDLDVDVADKEGKRTASWWPGFRVIDTRDVAPDPAVAAKIAGYEATLSRELDVVLGRTGTELDSRNAAVRGGEAAMGDVLADAIREATGADIGFLNGGSFRGNRLYPAGAEITRRDVLKELPFGNRTVLLEMTGAQVKAALEHGLADLSQPLGKFPQVSGMVVTADRNAPAGARVTSVTVAGKPLDPAATYRVATNDFLLRGGDGYTMFGQARVLTGERDAKLIANDLMVYFRRKGTVSQQVEGRIVIR